MEMDQIPGNSLVVFSITTSLNVSHELPVVATAWIGKTATKAYAFFDGMLDRMVKHFFNQMQSEFEMSLVGELTYFLGLQIKQMEDSIFLSQSKYAKNIIKNFGMDNASHKRTPAPTHLKLSKDESGTSVDQSLYRSMIGSLLYLTASRPDIAFAVGVCARYQAEPKVSHINQVKRILK
ncbi:uncharacterized mitochondrial protein AtMg00810-like [Vicia villosa]|uniref:uncharacterized mitochondrial protein AtMg00810-like n=1 Tax=Vicia villosa TaxID=3911 RepID=UPI00273C46D9|nr:uncharacterized mitochondrial protein AtMg00810-like [Vicia villosa]